MALKYEQHLKAASDQPCPCQRKFTARATRAYRFMRWMATERDFLPIALDPDKADEIAQRRCSAFALSFFLSLDQALHRWRDLASRLGSHGPQSEAGPRIECGRHAARQRYGDHIGEIDLVATDGLLGPVNRYGHMDLHEAEGVSFVARVKGYSPVLPAGSPANDSMPS